MTSRALIPGRTGLCTVDPTGLAIQSLIGGEDATATKHLSPFVRGTAKLHEHYWSG